MFPLQASSELTKSDGLIVLLGLLFIALRVTDEFSEGGRRQGQWSLERGLSAAEWLCQHPVISSEEKIPLLSSLSPLLEEYFLLPTLMKKIKIIIKMWCAKRKEEAFEKEVREARS